MNLHRRRDKKETRQSIEIFAFETRLYPALKIYLENQIIEYGKRFGEDRWLRKFEKERKNE
jgi:hypothetical protein